MNAHVVPVSCGVFLGVLSWAAAGYATDITTPSYFGSGATIVTFDLFSDGQAISQQVPKVTFRSESAGHIGSEHFTDPSDLHHRFDATMFALDWTLIRAGGEAKSGTMYAAGEVYLNWDVSDLRIDFAERQSAVAMWFIDNDFSAVQLSAYDARGTLLDAVIVPQSVEGGQSYHGVTGVDIRYVIIDGPEGAAIDSTFIDNLTFVPEPASLALLGLGAMALLRRRLRPAALRP